MRDNVKGGALTEVTFYICFPYLRPNMDMPLCSSFRKKQTGVCLWVREHFMER